MFCFRKLFTAKKKQSTMFEMHRKSVEVYLVVACADHMSMANIKPETEDVCDVGW